MAGWKLSTFLFAGTTLFLLGRDLLRQEPAAPRAQPPPEPVVAAPPAAPEAAETSLPPPPEPPPSEMPEKADELAYAVLICGTSLSDQERLARLEPRRDEIVRVLEDWIAREKEIYAAGASLERAFIAYARLKGKEAVPTLENLAVEEEHRQAGIDAAKALTWVEDPAATQAILRLQARQPEEVALFSCFDLVGRTEAATNVARTWEATAAYRPYARCAFFLQGSPQDRERVWESADREERQALLRRIPARWDGWNASILDAAAKLARSGDPMDRLAGINTIFRRPELFAPADIAAAEQALEADIVASPAETRKLLEWLKGYWHASKKQHARNERIRAVLIR